MSGDGCDTDFHHVRRHEFSTCCFAHSVDDHERSEVFYCVSRIDSANRFADALTRRLGCTNCGRFDFVKFRNFCWIGHTIEGHCMGPW